MIRSLSSARLTGKRVIVRCDYDVIKDGKIKDDERLEKSLPTIQYILKKKPKQVILIAHNGKPTGRDSALSLKPVAAWLEDHLKRQVGFVNDCLADIPPKPQVILLENLRFYKEEEKNDPAFAQALAKKADIYVNNAFATSHRAHASIVGIPKIIPGYAGLMLQEEVDNLSKITKSPKRPLVAILGFIKISDKILILEKLLTKADKVLLGGAVVFTFFKAQGMEVGNSIVEDSRLDLAQKLLKKYKKKLILPTDIVIADDLSGRNPRIVAAHRIPKNAIGLDIGTQSIEAYEKELADAKTVFWNGPLGMFEIPPFDAGTNHIAQYLAESKKTVIVGGGDTTKAMKNAGVYGKLTHISTGGGASLEFVQGDVLPGIKVLKK